MKKSDSSIPTLPLQSHPNFRSAYGPKAKVKLSMLPGEGRTKQSFKDECDINIIMARYAKTGVLENVNRGEARYLDVTSHDYRVMMETVAAARSMFEELPASVRARFRNDPANFLEFMQEPEKNQAEAVELGLATEKKPLKDMTAVTVDALREAFQLAKPATGEAPLMGAGAEGPKDGGGAASDKKKK